MNIQALLVAVAIVTAHCIAAVTTPVLAQNVTSGNTTGGNSTEGLTTSEEGGAYSEYGGSGKG
jgi:hypothetical protein